VVAGTVRKAACHVATVFRLNLKPSPIHIKGSTQLHPLVRSLFQSFENVDPATKQQKAATPKLLRRMSRLAGVDLDASRDTVFVVITELAIFGYFFAMRSCENTTTPKPGCTKLMCLTCITFRDVYKKVIPHHHHPGLTMVYYVTVVFVDQKNAKKMDARTQKRTNDPVMMCPVTRGASLVQRIRRMVPGFDGTTTINTVRFDNTTLRLTGEYLKTQLRVTCWTYGVKSEFGFDPHKIGTKSIHSSAAMSLFLKNHSSDRIMIFGRWLSKAFLDYIRQQVLEWTNNMSQDMISTDTFTDVGQFDMADPQVAYLACAPTG
jgi:hypothetical protein